MNTLEEDDHNHINNNNNNNNNKNEPVLDIKKNDITTTSSSTLTVGGDDNILHHVPITPIDMKGVEEIDWEDIAKLQDIKLFSYAPLQNLLKQIVSKVNDISEWQKEKDKQDEQRDNKVNQLIQKTKDDNDLLTSKIADLAQKQSNANDSIHKNSDHCKQLDNQCKNMSDELNQLNQSLNQNSKLMNDLKTSQNNNNNNNNNNSIEKNNNKEDVVVKKSNSRNNSRNNSSSDLKTLVTEENNKRDEKTKATHKTPSSNRSSRSNLHSDLNDSSNENEEVLKQIKSLQDQIEELNKRMNDMNELNDELKNKMSEMDEAITNQNNSNKMNDIMNNLFNDNNTITTPTTTDDKNTNSESSDEIQKEEQQQQQPEVKDSTKEELVVDDKGGLEEMMNRLNSLQEEMQGLKNREPRILKGLNDMKDALQKETQEKIAFSTDKLNRKQQEDNDKITKRVNDLVNDMAKRDADAKQKDELKLKNDNETKEKERKDREMKDREMKEFIAKIKIGLENKITALVKQLESQQMKKRKMSSMNGSNNNNNNNNNGSTGGSGGSGKSTPRVTDEDQQNFHLQQQQKLESLQQQLEKQLAEQQQQPTIVEVPKYVIDPDFEKRVMDLLDSKAQKDALDTLKQRFENLLKKLGEVEDNVKTKTDIMSSNTIQMKDILESKMKKKADKDEVHVMFDKFAQDSVTGGNGLLIGAGGSGEEEVTDLATISSSLITTSTMSNVGGGSGSVMYGVEQEEIVKIKDAINKLLIHIQIITKTKVDKIEVVKMVSEKSEQIEKLDQVKADAHIVARKAEREYVDTMFDRLRKEVDVIIIQTNSNTAELFAKDLAFLQSLIEDKASRSDLKKIRDYLAQSQKQDDTGDGLAGKKPYRCLSCNRTMQLRSKPLSMNFTSFVNHLPNPKTRLLPRKNLLNDAISQQNRSLNNNGNNGGETLLDLVDAGGEDFDNGPLLPPQPPMTNNYSSPSRKNSFSKDHGDDHHLPNILSSTL